jgi:uncharacterized repeat protein (TIGR01451 family)
MAHQDRISFVQTFSFVVGCLLLLTLTNTGVALAQTPVPLLTQPLVPDVATPGGSGFTLTVNGTGFASGAIVKWNGTSLATTFVSSSQLKATILPADVANDGTASVTVVNPGPGDDTSNVIFFEVTPATPSITLSPPAAFNAGSGPSSVAVGDFNGDSKQDLAVVNGNSNSVSILLGNGDGTFQSHVDYPTGAQPSSVAIGDFNGDGKLDLAIANQNCPSFACGPGSISILLGRGDGTFETAMQFSTGPAPHSVALGDFNRDGKLDLVVANTFPGSPIPGEISVLLGNGDGTFQPALYYGTGSGTGPAFVAVGDFNHDGKLDLAVANSLCGTTCGNTAGTIIAVLLGNGDGTFLAPVNYTVGSEPISIAVGDFNHDGKLDLAVANDNGSNVSILLGNGDGTFQPAVNYSTPFNPVSVAMGDFNGDGKLDLVTANNPGDDVSVLLGNGDGTFQPAVNYSAGSRPNSVAIGDFNGDDGRLDLAVADSGSTTVSILLQSPTVSLSNTSLTFAGQVLGTTSAPQTVTLSNTSVLTLNIGNIAVTGTNATDFGQTHSCGGSLLPGTSCTVTVTFSPTQIGPRTASVTITDNAAGSPQQIGLSGTGVISGPDATLSGSSIAFATELVGATSAAQSVTLSNYGTAPLGITSIATSGDFSQTNTCGSTLAVLAGCTISVTFKPTLQGSRAGTLSITDNAPGSSQTVSLSGTGTSVSADLATTIWASYAGVGGYLWYKITVTNKGPDTATNVTATDNVPFRTTFYSVATTTGSCTSPRVGGTGTVTCTALSLPNAGSMIITLAVKILAFHNQAISDTATATSATFDPNTANNTATVVSRVN